MKAATKYGDYGIDAVSLSIHAAREGGDNCRVTSSTRVILSIHAAREGGDGGENKQAAIYCLSIHAAREGGDSS